MMQKLLLLFTLPLVLVGCQSQLDKGNVQMTQDEKSIRRWFDDWIEASTNGDLELARSLIADDAVFLVPGAGRMDKESFAAAATADDPNTDFQLDCSIDEIHVQGDTAWLLSTLSLTITDKSTKSQSLMKGDGMSLLQRKGEGWVVFRDANTMVAVDNNQ